MNIIASKRGWTRPCGRGWNQANNPHELIEIVKWHNPDYIFFPHWSWKIPPEIFEKYECIAFHMTDLPYGRGGSPLQNLIIRGATKTKITAFRVTEEMDAGPIYLKEDLSLKGSAQEILNRTDEIIEGMIDTIKRNYIKPTPQQSEPSTFKRRTPEQSDIRACTDAEEIYNHIRMLDGPGYPSAYLEILGKRFEFTDAHLDGDKVIARVAIT